MDYPTDNIHHKTILALRAGSQVADNALVAHYTKGSARKLALDDALENADRVTAAAAALRAEIAALEVEASQALEAAQ